MCIDLISINQEYLFSNSNKCEVGTSDHHHLVSTMINKKNSKNNTIIYFIEIMRDLRKRNLGRI